MILSQKSEKSYVNDEYYKCCFEVWRILQVLFWSMFDSVPMC